MNRMNTYLLIAVLAIPLPVEAFRFVMHRRAAFQAAGGSTLTTGLVSWWGMQEASGTRADSHGSNTLQENGTGGVGQTNGHVQANAAYMVKSETDYLSITNNTSFDPEGGTSPISFNAWVYHDGRAGTAIMSKGNEIIYRVDNAHYEVILNSFTTNDRADDDLNPPLSEWVMRTFTYDGTTLEVYTNGVSAASVEPTGSWAEITSDIYIGRWSSSYMDGRVEQVAWWTKGLTADEVTELWNSGAGLAYGDL